METRNNSKFGLYLKLFVAGAIIGVLATFIYSWHSRGEKIKQLLAERATIDTAVHAAGKLIALQAEKLDSMDTELFASYERIHTLQDQLDTINGRVKSSGDSAKKYVRLYYSAKADLDTAQMLNNCDEVVQSCNEFYEQVKLHIAYDDSVAIARLDTDLKTNNLIDTLKSQNKRLSTSYMQCIASNQSLILDLQNAKKKPKRTFFRRLGDWLIGAGVGYGVRAATAK